MSYLKYPSRYLTWTLPLTVPPMGAVRQNKRSLYSKDPARRKAIQLYYAYCDELRLQAKLNHFTLMDDMGFEFHFTMPPSWSHQKRAKMIGHRMRSKPDWDNCIKALMDALCKNDEKISGCCGVRKIWGLENKIVIYKEIG